MSFNVEKTVAEVLRLVSGRGETVVALTEGGAVRLDRWACRYWSIRRDLLTERGDIVVALWLHGVSELVADEETAKYATSTPEYEIMKEESERLGVEGGPDVQYLTLHFKPVELDVKKVYGNRVVYGVKPCRDEIEVSVVRLYQPAWRVCEYRQRRDGDAKSRGLYVEDCRLRETLTERIRARGLHIEDVVEGVYVPLDVSELVRFLRRVL